MIPKDKVKHLIAGAIISAITYGLVMLIFKSQNDALYISIFMASIGGYVKEKYDVSKGRKGDYLDWLATFVGGLVVSLILFIL